MARRCSFSLPEQVSDDLRSVSARLGVTQSALLVQLLGWPLNDLARLVDSIPENPTPEDVRRLRGASVALIQSRVSEAMDVVREVANGHH